MTNRGALRYRSSHVIIEMECTILGVYQVLLLPALFLLVFFRLIGLCFSRVKLGKDLEIMMRFVPSEFLHFILRLRKITILA